MLEFLTHSSSRVAPDGGVSLATDIELATRLLEALGHATTKHCHNASKCGCLYKLYFDRLERCVTGCEILIALDVEKTRVTRQDSGERCH